MLSQALEDALELVEVVVQVLLVLVLVGNAVVVQTPSDPKALHSKPATLLEVVVSAAATETRTDAAATAAREKENMVGGYQYLGIRGKGGGNA